MHFSFILIALFVVSVFTSLTVQGIKKIQENIHDSHYPSNILAVIVSVALSALLVLLYCLYTNTAFTVKIGVETAVLMYLSFLVSTNGYDKVMQTIKQIQTFIGKDG